MGRKPRPPGEVRPSEPSEQPFAAVPSTSGVSGPDSPTPTTDGASPETRPDQSKSAKSKTVAKSRAPKQPAVKISGKSGRRANVVQSGPDSTKSIVEQQPVFPVIGIGASAGGLNAFKKFFSKMPVDSGAAFVVVPHLDRTHASLMAELLARQTTMPVCEARDAMPLEPNCVYVIPPNKYLAIVDRKLQLSAPAEGPGATTAIDFFFRTLAVDQRERAIGIVLSGTSSHGTLGLKEIKLAGGMVMAQQPESAEHDQMPRNAIATGLVDFVLPPEQMPDALVKYLRHPYIHDPDQRPAEEALSEQLNRILALLRTRTKYDFRSYRKKMLIRRVLRRMGLCHFEQMPEYLDYLRVKPDEVNALCNDLLIGVTDFFRDAEAFQVLQQRVIPELVNRTAVTPLEADDDSRWNAARSKIRIWIPACATGEEAYSIAMLFIEQFSAENKPTDVQIFATDIDERSLEAARQGVYTDGSVAEISPERLRRFFTKFDAHHWQVNKQLRELITFAPQNLISDAPFSKLDLICCRNLLIYLEPEVQAKVIRLFHFSLVDGGYLLLGPSESIGREVDLFEPVSKKWRVFRRIGPIRRGLVEIPISASEDRRRLHVVRSESMPTPAIGYKELMQRLILDEFAPASTLINRNHEIVSVLGPLVNYLEFPAGELTKDLLAMARPGLRTKIRAAVFKAIQTGESVTDHDARVKRNGTYASCSITVKPVAEPKDAAGLLLVTFQDRASVGRATSDTRDARPVDDEESHLIQHLEHELKSARDDLQSTIEEYESSNEELKASNEEVMSMNEELQSANEELETSKEELQSLNEELSTVNIQLQEKVEELDRSNSDLTNLMASSEVATVFLDSELRIKRFTPPVAKLLNLRATDLERAFSDFAPKFSDNTLLEDCQTVLDKLTPIEKEVWTTEISRNTKQSSEAGGRKRQIATAMNSLPGGVFDPARSHCYLRKILPYRTADNRIVGVVITFVEITQRIVAEAQSRRLATVLMNSNDAITIHDFEGHILAWNRGAEKMYGYTEAEALRMNIVVTVPENKRAEALVYAQSLARGELVKTFETQRRRKDGGILDVELTATAYRDELGRLIGAATTERDISERIRVTRILRQLNDSLEQRVADQTREARLLAEAISHLGEGVLITADHLEWPGPKILFVNDAMCRISGYQPDELLGQSPRILQGQESNRQTVNHIKQELSASKSCLVELINYRKDGAPYHAELFITPLFDHEGRRTNFVCIHRDITERKRTEQALRDQEALARSVLDAMSAHIAILDREGRIVRVNSAWERFAAENGATELTRSGVGTNYLSICQQSAERGDETASTALSGLRAVLDKSLPEFTLEYACDSDHEQRWYLLYAATAAQSATWGAVVSHIQITDRKRAEAALKEREERLQAILNTAIDAIITIDQCGIITIVNPATEQMFGYSRDELLGQNVRILMPPPYHDEHDAYIERFLKTGEARIIGIGGEVAGRRKDGSTFPVDLAVSQVDHMGLFTGIIRDISHRKELQKQVLGIAAEEQRRIGQELHDGTGQELTGLTLFAGTIVDLLNQIKKGEAEENATWILHEADLLRLRQTAQRLTEGLAEANRHVQQLSHGIMPVQIEAEGLRSALEELARATDSQQNITCRFDCPVPIVVANNTAATYLYRIAQESINNALRHSRADQICIALLEANEEIILEVSDNGIGFDTSSFGRTGVPGTHRGFGLEIMNYRAGIIGGTFRVSRPPGGGTLVRCVIPRRRAST